MKPLILTAKDEFIGPQPDAVYLDFRIACPVCGFDYSHIREAFTEKGYDEFEAGVYRGTIEKGECGYRRSALSIVFDGECGHAWKLVIQQHKGQNFLIVQIVPWQSGDERDGVR